MLSSQFNHKQNNRIQEKKKCMTQQQLYYVYLNKPFCWPTASCSTAYLKTVCMSKVDLPDCEERRADRTKQVISGAMHWQLSGDKVDYCDLWWIAKQCVLAWCCPELPLPVKSGGEAWRWSLASDASGSSAPSAEMTNYSLYSENKHP